jgi:hypothetical protein
MIAAAEFGQLKQYSNLSVYELNYVLQGENS